MQITLKEAKDLATNFVQSLEFSANDTGIIVENTLEAELSGHLSHGLGNLLWFRDEITTDQAWQTTFERDEYQLSVTKETPVSLLVDGNNHAGFVVIRAALDRAFNKVTKSFIVATALTNTAPTTGYLGHYARLAAEKNLLFLCWNTSPGRVAPHGSTSCLWGTNPITIGIPTNGYSTILDMATSQITVGQLLKNKREGLLLPFGSAIDKKGLPTNDPSIAWDEGALTAIGGHKGSGLSFMNEMIAGALTMSKVGFAVQGGWGTFFLLIDPTIFRPIEDFKSDVEAGIVELKQSAKAKRVKEIFYPGEHSQKIRQRNLMNGFIEISDGLYAQLKS